MIEMSHVEDSYHGVNLLREIPITQGEIIWDDEAGKLHLSLSILGGKNTVGGLSMVESTRISRRSALRADSKYLGSMSEVLFERSFPEFSNVIKHDEIEERVSAHSLC